MKISQKEILPTEMTLGCRTYEILNFHKENETHVRCIDMVARAKEMGINLGEEDARHILKHQNEIPERLREKAAFAFTDWHFPCDPSDAHYVFWSGSCWREARALGSDKLTTHFRLLRLLKLQIEMTIAGRTYEILSFHKEDELYVLGYTMVKRAVEMSANLGEDDGQYILKHQNDIPEEFRVNVIFVFPDWRHPDDTSLVSCIYCGNYWTQMWEKLNYDCARHVYILRRKQNS